MSTPSESVLGADVVTPELATWGGFNHHSGLKRARSFVAEMITEPRRLPPLFVTVLDATRAKGIDADQLLALLEFSRGEGSDPVRPGQLIARVERRLASGKRLQLF